MSGETIDIPKSLQLDVCPFCGYSLNGLPAEGICPECGKRYDSSQIVLHGYGRGDHENTATAKKSRIFWLVLGPAAYLIYIGFFDAHRILGDPFFVFLFLILGIRPLFRLIRRSQTWHPGLVQVRLSARGCAQFDDLSDSSLLREFIECYYGYAIAIAAAVAVTAILDGWIRLSNPWFYSLILTFIALPQLWTSHRYKRALPSVRDGSAINLNMALVKRALWPYAKSFWLDRQSDHAWHLRIAHKTIDWPVDAEIDLTPEQAEDLRQWLSNQIPQAAGKAQEVKPPLNTAESAIANT
jgi:hypothetical protein